MLIVVLIPFSVFVAYVALYIATAIVVLPLLLLSRALGLLCRSTHHATVAREPVERLEPVTAYAVHLRQQNRPRMLWKLDGTVVPLVGYEAPRRLTYDG